MTKAKPQRNKDTKPQSHKARKKQNKETIFSLTNAWQRGGKN
jgi:hypothetical protein